jgi:hypothetical protein
VVGDERLGIEELEHVALERGVGPRLFLEKTDRGLVAVEGRPKLALFDEGPGPEGVVAEAPRFLADAGGLGRRGLVLLLVDKLFDGLAGGLASGLRFRSHGHLLRIIGSRLWTCRRKRP